MTSSASVFQLIEQKIRMCTELLGSGSFVAMLEYLLVVGNFLNKNAGKTAAKGFRLSSLSKVRCPGLWGADLGTGFLLLKVTFIPPAVSVTRCYKPF